MENKNYCKICGKETNILYKGGYYCLEHMPKFWDDEIKENQGEKKHEKKT